MAQALLFDNALSKKSPNQKNSNKEYFVSFCVMTEGSNPMGHSFILISRLDDSHGNKVQMEVLHAMGVYSQPMPVLGFKPYAVAHIKLKENMKYIAGRGGLGHETYECTQQDVKKLVDVFKRAKLQVEHYEAATKTAPHLQCQSCQSVPMFNVFSKQNCKKYVLDAMRQIGIDTGHLNSFMEIPIFNTLDVMRISKAENAQGDKTYYWSSPMRYQAKKQQSVSNLPLQSHYADLYQTYGRTNKLLNIVKERQTELTHLGKTVQEIENIERDLLAINTEIEKVAAYPKLITRRQIFELTTKLTSCVRRHLIDLETKKIEPNLITILADVLSELFLYCEQFLGFHNKRSQSKL